MLEISARSSTRRSPIAAWRTRSSASPTTSPQLFQAGEPPKIPGAGPALTAKLAELAETGQLGYYDKLRAQVPTACWRSCKIPGVGPRTVKLLHDELGIDSRRCAAGRRRGRRPARPQGPLGADRAEHPGGHRAARVADGTRLLLHDADALMAGLVDALRDVPGRAAHRAGRIAAPAEGDDRRPGPAGGDR